MSRVQLALNVSDLDAAVDFYSKLFATTPAKLRPGYANFAVADPPLKLVLIENPDARGAGVGGALNHLGVEVESDRSGDPGYGATLQDGSRHHRAVPHDVLLRRAGQGVGRGSRRRGWEIYTVLGDAPAVSGLDGDGSCCGSDKPVGGARGHRSRRSPVLLSGR